MLKNHKIYINKFSRLNIWIELNRIIQTNEINKRTTFLQFSSKFRNIQCTIESTTQILANIPLFVRNRPFQNSAIQLSTLEFIKFAKNCHLLLPRPLVSTRLFPAASLSPLGQTSFNKRQTSKVKGDARSAKDSPRVQQILLPWNDPRTDFTRNWSQFSFTVT